MKKPIITASNSKQVKKTDELVKQLILNRVNNNSSSDKFLNENLDKYNEKETILDMVSKMPYRKFIAKEKAIYEKKFPRIFYDELFRLTGLLRDPNNPNYKPHVFARLTLQIIYRRFPEGIIKYFEEENPTDVNGFRSYKHFQLLNKLGEKKLLSVIEEAVGIMKTSNHWQHFLRLYALKFGLTYQIPLFLD
jgi:hypothetical protein